MAAHSRMGRRRASVSDWVFIQTSYPTVMKGPPAPWCAVGTFADGLSQSESPLKSPQRLTVVPYVRTCCFVFGFAPGIPGLKPGRGSYSLFSNYSRSDFGSDYYSDYTFNTSFNLVSIPNRSPSLSNVLTKPAVEVRVGWTGTIRIRVPSQT
jgi:hypothetical protein